MPLVLFWYTRFVTLSRRFGTMVTACTWHCCDSPQTKRCFKKVSQSDSSIVHGDAVEPLSVNLREVHSGQGELLEKSGSEEALQPMLDVSLS